GWASARLLQPQFRWIPKWLASSKPFRTKRTRLGSRRSKLSNMRRKKLRRLADSEAARHLHLKLSQRRSRIQHRKPRVKRRAEPRPRLLLVHQFVPLGPYP